jgi:hypothetical protein
MRKIITSAFVAASMLVPSVALADHTDTRMTYDSEEECSSALAEMRRDQSASLKGRERGQFNKDFNAKHYCEEVDEDTYAIMHTDDD